MALYKWRFFTGQFENLHFPQTNNASTSFFSHFYSINFIYTAYFSWNYFIFTSYMKYFCLWSISIVTVLHAGGQRTERHSNVISSMLWWPRTRGAVITLPSGLYSVSVYLYLYRTLAHCPCAADCGLFRGRDAWTQVDHDPSVNAAETHRGGATLATAGANELSTYCTALMHCRPAPVQASTRFIVLISPSSSSQRAMAGWAGAWKLRYWARCWEWEEWEDAACFLIKISPDLDTPQWRSVINYGSSARQHTTADI